MHFIRINCWWICRWIVLQRYIKHLFLEFRQRQNKFGVEFAGSYGYFFHFSNKPILHTFNIYYYTHHSQKITFIKCCFTYIRRKICLIAPHGEINCGRKMQSSFPLQMTIGAGDPDPDLNFIQYLWPPVPIWVIVSYIRYRHLKQCKLRKGKRGPWPTSLTSMKNNSNQ